MTQIFSKKLSLNKNGFTTVELLISISIISILIPVLLTVTFGFYGDLLRQSARAQLTLESQDLLQIFTEQLRIATAVRDTPVQTDANAPIGGWQTSDANNVFITALPTVGTNGQYIIDPDTNEPYETDTIYFQSGKLLRRRSIVDPAAVGEKQSTSCPDAVASSSCSPDNRLTDNFKDLTFVFYDQDNVVTAVPTSARSVKLSLTLEKRVGGKTITTTNSLRMTLRN